MADASIASRWKDLSGQNNWNGLLHPLDPDLRRYIIHYGERTAAVGDLFDGVNCKSSKKDFFSISCLVKGNKFKYEVTHFFYAGSRPTSVNPAWFGYVAVTTDDGKAVLGRRDILVVWRGTRTATEWLNNARLYAVSASDLFKEDTEAKVHCGYLTIYTGSWPDSVSNKISAREQVPDAVRELLTKYKDEEGEVSITVTGFSLGGALATLNAMDIVANNHNRIRITGHPAKSCMVTAFTFGAPFVGNSGLLELYEKLVHDHNFHLLRIKNYNDPVPKLPYPSVGYVHLGEELIVNSSISDYLKRTRYGRSIVDDQEEEDLAKIMDPEERESRGLFKDNFSWFSAHSMDVYLHSVAGLKEKDGKILFELDSEPHYHDYALVNKHLDRLRDEYGIPANWWEDENRKNMVQMEDGSWVNKNATTSN
ncbi:Lipase, class 3 [Corchorus capsularis]|uniref:Phospholipase A1 n=1 Tax=Corchorus capsularis TaxID=210143 RepID=A0A1R3I146_COCAP|nr:Lipase, class 3 [Corchorus capsularis]